MSFERAFDLAEVRAEVSADHELVEAVMSLGLSDAGRLLNRRAEDSFGSATDYWQRLIAEFRRLICDPSAKEYGELRKKAKEAADAGKVLGLSALAVVVADTVGLSVGLVTPFLALLIQALLKVGIAAWCKGGDEFLEVQLDLEDSD